ncbi:hypothetical protein AB4Y44_13955 [Paraburkholderia sp. BR10937]|uniref:hypothetical protein n=1 Tax=Paraburkholderia sp. BR10937 TaxID=3236994 RepID=UPI0034D196B8
MKLCDFESALGRAICEQQQPLETSVVQLPALERERLEQLLSSAGVAFTRIVQRSWCESRIKLLARHSLGELPPEQCSALVSAWVDRGGGRNAFGGEEAIEFLKFLSPHLPSDSASSYWCRVELATFRAYMGSLEFVPPASPCERTMLIVRNESASLVSTSQAALFFAPGLPELVREATPLERELWMDLELARRVNVFPDAALTSLNSMLSVGILASTE